MQDIKKIYDRWLYLDSNLLAYRWFLLNQPLEAYRALSYEIYRAMREQEELRKQAQEWGLQAVNPYRLLEVK